MHILFLTREYKHPDLPACGGTGVFYMNLAHKLIKNGHVVTVFGVSKKEISFNDNGVNIYFIKDVFKRNKLLNITRSITKKISFISSSHLKIFEYEKKEIANKLKDYISSHNILVDIIETHDFDGLSLYLDNTIPYAIRCHGSWTILEKYFGYTKVQIGRKHCEKKAIEKAENIITISKFSKKANEELFNIKNTKLIYNGINTTEFQRDLSIPTIPYSLFFIGNISIEKGADVAFSVFCKIEKVFPQATLHFIGRENNELKKEILDKTDELKIADKIIFHGFQQKEKAITLLNQAHIILFPSKGETFGLALCETMSMQIPAICSNIEAFNEIITPYKNGMVANNNSDFITKCIELFNDINLFENIKANSRKTVLDKFSLEMMTKTTSEYYTEIIKQKK